MKCQKHLKVSENLIHDHFQVIRISFICKVSRNSHSRSNIWCSTGSLVTFGPAKPEHDGFQIRQKIVRHFAPCPSCCFIFPLCPSCILWKRKMNKNGLRFSSAKRFSDSASALHSSDSYSAWRIPYTYVRKLLPILCLDLSPWRFRRILFLNMQSMFLTFDGERKL